MLRLIFAHANLCARVHVNQDREYLPPWHGLPYGLGEGSPPQQRQQQYQQQHYQQQQAQQRVSRHRPLSSCLFDMETV